MADRLGGSASVRSKSGLHILTLALAAAGFGAPASAGTASLFGIAEADYKLTLGYAIAMRTKDPAQGLINGPVDPFQSEVMPNSDQIVGFTHTGLRNTTNFDDGDRNFKKYSLINNRVSAYGEVKISRENYGAVLSGSAFYDKVYRSKNDNTSLPGMTDGSTINKLGPVNEFTDETRKFSGKRARLLESYVYGNWDLGEETHLNLRFGKQLVAWGESLFFSGVALAQGPADAAKAFVAGAEVKDILLPINQVAMRLSLNDQITLLAQYKLAFKPTELFPNGDFFSPADLIGPGATFGYGSVNPAYASECQGLLDFPGLPDLSDLCMLGGGLGGPALGADPYLYVTRMEDLNADKNGNYGVGITAQVTPGTSVGLYRLRYYDTSPAINLNFGYPVVLTFPTTVTTELITQPTPVSYNVQYYGDIDLTALTASTAFGPFNVAGELIFRQNHDVQVQSIISGVLSPIYTRGNLTQLLVSSIYVSNPGFIVDDIAWVTEGGFIHVNSVEPVPESYGKVPVTSVGVGTVPPGGEASAVDLVGNGDVLFNDQNSWAFQTLFIGGNHNVISGWDLKTQVSYAMILNGNPPMSGVFGSLIGEGDKRLGISFGMTYLSNLEIALGYNFFFGDPNKRVNDISPVEQNPYADRDNVSLTVKYNL